MITKTYDPEQWQLVPKVATDEMLRFICNCDITIPPDSTFNEVYDYFLAAAPQHPEPSEPLNCPDCSNQGWYAVGCAGDFEQVQCQFCYTEPNSVFNRTQQAAPQHESQWQDISTAPRGGRILVWSPDIGQCVASAGWDTETPDDIRWGVANDIYVEPTLWMPLPQHPNTIKVPRPEGHDSWSIEIKTSYGGGGGKD